MWASANISPQPENTNRPALALIIVQAQACRAKREGVDIFKLGLVDHLHQPLGHPAFLGEGKHDDVDGQL